MKNIQLFDPRAPLMGVYSFKDIANFRIEIANDLMFCSYNTQTDMQKLVIDFDPSVR